jgi:TonB family protein
MNRIYLISTALLSFVIPVLQADWLRSLFITQQVQQASENIAYAFGTNTVLTAGTENVWTVMDWVSVLYISGCVVLGVRFFWQLYNIGSINQNATGQAFSFFRRIVISKDLDQYQTIHRHEQVHAHEWHSADVLYFEIVGIINWFNPAVYVYKSAIKAIHEFIADEQTAMHLPSKGEYALLLVDKAFGVPANQLTNSFYKPSLLKRRIIMLNKSKSRKIAILKYGLSVPLFVLMLIFTSATVKQDKVQVFTENLKDAALPSLSNAPAAEAKYGKLPAAPPAAPSTARPSSALSDTSKSKPIYIIEGRETSAKVIQAINPNYIDAVNVLKGADAKAKYGAKGVNGVIEITLKAAAPSDKDTTKSSQGVPEQAVAVVASQQKPVFTAVEVLPQFPGGKKGWSEFVAKYKYPAEAVEKGVSGRVILQFVVEEDGSLTDINLVRDPGFGTGEAAIELLKTSPKWLPGIQNGRPVRVAYTQTISLNLEKQ